MTVDYLLPRPSEQSQVQNAVFYPATSPRSVSRPSSSEVTRHSSIHKRRRVSSNIDPVTAHCQPNSRDPSFLQSASSRDSSQSSLMSQTSLAEVQPESVLVSCDPSTSTLSFHHENFTQPENKGDPGNRTETGTDQGRSDGHSTDLESKSIPPPKPLHQQNSSDDSAVEDQPMSQVDYLSHNWKEEDIWSSWRYVKSKRHEYTESVRLENASWRSWIQRKNGLTTIPPESLDWFKDCDVTWLYGPLKPHDSHLQVLSPPESPPSSPYKSNGASLEKKSILKKKSVSQAILQRTRGLEYNFKNDSFAPETRDDFNQGDRSAYERVVPGLAFDSMSSLGDVSETSSIVTNSTTRRHISFNNEVSQCVAVDDDQPDSDDYFGGFESCVIDDDDVSEECYGMYGKNWDCSPIFSGPTSPGSHYSSESRTIAMLPSTTLKPAPGLPSDDQSQLPNTSISSFYPFSWWPLLSMPGLQRNASAETLRPTSPPPSTPDHEIDKGSDDDDIDDDEEVPSAPAVSVKPSTHRSDKGQQSRYPLISSSVPAGERRERKDLGPPSISSAILASLNFYWREEEEEEEMETETETGGGEEEDLDSSRDEPDNDHPGDYKVVDQILDTVNTARDIAHVIWNIGWRD